MTCRSPQLPLRRKHLTRLLASAALAGTLLTPSFYAMAQDEAPPREAVEPQLPGVEAPGSRAPAELGVVAAPSPGPGVLVVGVMPGAPAAQAGLHMGDFILSIDGQEISTPQELIATLRDKQAGDRIALVVWRNGEQLEREAHLMAQTPETRRANQAWLGVGLGTEPDGTVRVERVSPQSPAARAGLQPGDRLIALGDQPIRSVEALIHQVQQAFPGDEVPLRIKRGEEEQTVAVRLGSVRDLGGPSFRTMFRRDLGNWLGEPDVQPELDLLPPDAFPAPADADPQQSQHILQMLEQMQNDLRQLRQQVDALQQDLTRGPAEPDQAEER